MKVAGIREARQNLSVLLEEVKAGAEIVLTDRGRPVARLVPYREDSPRPFPGRAGFRSGMPRLTPPLSETVSEERDDRL